MSDNKPTITDKHRKAADKLYKLLSNTFSIEGREFRKRHGAGMDIMNWFLDHKIITGFKRESFSKGTNFYSYTNIDDLMKPKDDKPTINIEVKDGGQVGGINTGDIDGGLNQSLKNESTNTLTNPTTPLTTKDSPTTSITTAIIKTISLRTKEILIGIVISVIAALIVWKITGQV